MKIVAGLSDIEEYENLCMAGADEVFCGYVPFEWNEQFGNVEPLNRREVLYYNVQIGSISDMKILSRMVTKYKVPVTVVFNSLYYSYNQYVIIEKYIKELMNLGFDKYIIADIGLIHFLVENNIDCKIQLSGEACQLNSLACKWLGNFKIKRYIFHRKNSIKNMESCIQKTRIVTGVKEYEAFILNEKCNYTGAYCNSLHCDELVHLCKIPYIMSGYDEKIDCDSDGNKDNDEIIYENENEDLDEYEIENKCCENGYISGIGGCGLCALYDLKKAGITHLKVVGRGNSSVNIIKDIQVLKKALMLLEECENKKDFKSSDFAAVVKNVIFQGKCSGDCYYELDSNS